MGLLPSPSTVATPPAADERRLTRQPATRPAAHRLPGQARTKNGETMPAVDNTTIGFPVTVHPPGHLYYPRWRAELRLDGYRAVEHFEPPPLSRSLLIMV